MSRRRGGAVTASTLLTRCLPGAREMNGALGARTDRRHAATSIRSAPPPRASPLSSSRVQLLPQPWVHPPRVVLEYLFLISRAQRQRVDITLRIVVELARARVDTPYSTDHL